MNHESMDVEKSEEDFPEFLLQKDIGKIPEYKPKQSGELWYLHMIEGRPFDAKSKAELLLSVKKELPFLISAVMERACNLQCAHCLYQPEKTSAILSRDTNFKDVVRHVVTTMPEASEEYPAKFLSAGRILQPWHLELFKELREARPDVKLGIIDNGTFTNHLQRWPEGFKFDWIDISIDGTEAHHNEQRGSSRAYDLAMRGLGKAREVVLPVEKGGHVSSLLTLTNINARDISLVADTLFEKKIDGISSIDQLNITTVSPTNSINSTLETTVEDFAQAWESLSQACKKYNTNGKERIFLNIYRIQDIEKLATVVGKQKFKDMLSNVFVDRGFLSFSIDNIPVSYLPLSVWPLEEFLIDADGAYRTAYEGKFTLDELRSGKSKNGEDTSAYTISQLTSTIDFREEYEKGVDHYWKHFGHIKLEEEFVALHSILQT